jgi:hypothetical protein
MLMALVEAANLAVRFLAELCVLAGLGYWGFHTGTGLFVKILLGIGAPLAVALVWGAFGAPASEMKLHGAPHLLLELAVFGSGAGALYAAGRPGLAGAFGLVVVINRILMYVWGQ